MDSNLNTSDTLKSNINRIQQIKLNGMINLNIMKIKIKFLMIKSQMSINLMKLKSPRKKIINVLQIVIKIKQYLKLIKINKEIQVAI